MTIGESGIDTTVAHPARRYNYWLGGKDNFAADRASGDEIEQKFPGMRAGVRANRDVLGRMVHFLAGEAGIRQFLDVGTGLPTADNTHEVAQLIAPDSRVVYVDNDPMVMVHAQALLTSVSAGRTTYIEADLREPAAILASPGLRGTLELGKPVALMLVAILHFVPGEGAARPPVRELLDALPSGSYLAATHFTTDYMPAEERERYAGMLTAGRPQGVRGAVRGPRTGRARGRAGHRVAAGRRREHRRRRREPDQHARRRRPQTVVPRGKLNT